LQKKRKWVRKICKYWGLSGPAGKRITLDSIFEKKKSHSQETSEQRILDGAKKRNKKKTGTKAIWHIF
jgi:hypothetical protein